MKQEMYVKKTMHFLLFLIGGKIMSFLIRPPPDRAEKVRTTDQPAF
jgi:hypothetical protein